ncbi:MAG: PKD domain-containing protein, partial [Thermoplasmata archaeon]|nr:PKD domain-containing protein [Thermoplasmata archaeon]
MHKNGVIIYFVLFMMVFVSFNSFSIGNNVQQVLVSARDDFPIIEVEPQSINPRGENEPVVFTNRSPELDIPSITGDSFAWGDYNNDGHLDFITRGNTTIGTRLFKNNGPPNYNFTDVTNQSNISKRGYPVWADYNNDGYLDLITAGKSPYVAEGQGKYEIHLYQNSGNSNNWLKVSLNGTTSNRFAIGARVKVTVGSVTMMREVEGGMGCNGHQNSLILHFGLGTGAIVDEIEVRWPDGRLQFLENVAVNQLLNITEPSDPLPTVTNVQLSPAAPQEDEQVTFTATVNAGGATVTNLQWDFEADNVFDYESTAFTAQHTYTIGGLKHARLRVLTNQDAGIDYYPIEFEVKNLVPVAVFDANVTYQEDEMAVFNASQCTDTASDLAARFEFYWMFGDGVELNWSTNHTVSHVYSEEGLYTVNLSVRDIDGAVGYQEKTISVQNVPPVIEILPDIIGYEDNEIAFTANATDTQSDLDTLWYKWEFGDGTGTILWSQTTDATHTYTAKGNYSAKLIARDDDLVESIAIQNVTILNPVPTCTITLYDNAVSEDELTLFDGEGTDTASDADSLEYYWDFGDLNITEWSSSTSATHTFTNAGNYSVRLYIKDDDSALNYSEVLVTVLNVAPSCIIETEDMTVDEDELVDFEGTGTDTQSDLANLLYSWDIGDGNITDWSTNSGAEHAYLCEDEYDVILYVKDDNGVIIASESIEV